MRNATNVKVLALVSNGISSEMLRQALLADGYDYSQVALVLQRPVVVPWASKCSVVLNFPAKPSLSFWGQLPLLSFYVRSARLARSLLSGGNLKDVYVANVDNLIANHIVNQVSKRKLEQPRISVVAEGFMNYQNITTKDRARWRWLVKPLTAALLGLTYKRPTGHLSGSNEDVIARVFAYSSLGLKSPPEKFRLAEFPKVKITKQPDPKAALVVLTGIAQWMKPEMFAAFKQSFVDWVNIQGFEKVFVKRHPFYPSGGVEDLLRNATIIDDPRRLEEIADELPAQTVIGYCTTALVILKLMRPDLHFIDWGSNFYCEHAYHGDYSVVDALRGAGVHIIDMTSAPQPLRMSAD